MISFFVVNRFSDAIIIKTIMIYGYFQNLNNNTILSYVDISEARHVPDTVIGTDDADVA